jgi:pimeloyl-ACP methyl ester carboxylesterase
MQLTVSFEWQGRQIADYDERYLEEIEQRLDQLEIPVRVLWGADDTWIPLDIGERLTSLIADATLYVIDDAGHLIQYDTAVAVADEIRVWLGDHNPGGSDGTERLQRRGAAGGIRPR